MTKQETDLALIVMDGYADRGEEVAQAIRVIGGKNKNCKILQTECVRFSNGEGKVRIRESVRAKDVYILCDIGNYNCTYKMFGFINHKSPDDHLQDIKRTVSAIGGKARRITVLMPLLYASRQHRRIGRESLDCALALQELESIGVSNVITFDAHDPNVQNAVPLGSFDNIYPTYPILKEVIQTEKNNIHKDKMVVISPDTGAMGRTVQYADMLGLDVGMFYKRRDYSIIVKGQNPIIEHTYTGCDIKGKSALIVDDMIASGGSVIDVAHELKARGARDISVIASFAFFTEGLEKFNQLYEEGVIKHVYSTNLSYISPEVKAAKWFKEVDLTRFIALIINTINNNCSISPLIESKDKIKEILEKIR